jgi:hypothetical protein
MALVDSFQIKQADWQHDVFGWSVSAAFALPLLGLIAGFARLRSKSAAMAASLLCWVVPAALLFSLVVIAIPF